MERDKEHFHLLLYYLDSKKMTAEAYQFISKLFWVCSS